MKIDLISLVTKNNIQLNFDLIEEFTERLLGITPQKKQYVNQGIQTNVCEKTKKLIEDLKMLINTQMI
jgi:uncharacterized protein YajQ (UPF0234 family)